MKNKYLGGYPMKNLWISRIKLIGPGGKRTWFSSVVTNGTDTHPVLVSFRCSYAVPFWSFFVVFLNPLACISGSILSNQIWGSVSYTVVPSCSLVALTSPFVKLLHPPGKGSHWKAGRECLEHLWVHPQKAWALLTLPARGLLLGDRGSVTEEGGRCVPGPQRPAGPSHLWLPCILLLPVSVSFLSCQGWKCSLQKHQGWSDKARQSWHRRLPQGLGVCSTGRFCPAMKTTNCVVWSLVLQSWVLLFLSTGTFYCIRSQHAFSGKGSDGC